MADIASVALKYTADTSGYISSLRGAASANRDFGSSLDTSTKADRFRVPDMSAMTAPLTETVRLLREISAIQMAGLSTEKQIAVHRQLQAEATNRMMTAEVTARAAAGGGAGNAGAVGQINAETSAFARQLAMRKEAAALRVAQNMAAARSAEIVREESRAAEELAQNLARANAAKIAAINAKTVNVSESSRFDNANPFAQQVMATQKLNALLAQRKTLTDDLARAENRLAITQQVAEVRSIRANLTADSTINRFRNLGNTADDSLKNYKRFQLGVQNAGYQVQDFFVQVASGQSKLVALAQQLPQLLGPIGMYGALAGVAVSIGAVAYQTLSASKNADTAAQKFRTLKEATDALAESQRQLSLIGKDEFAEMPFFEEQLTKAQTQLDAVKKQIDAEKKSALAAQKSASASIGIVSPGAVGSRDIKTNADQEKRLAEAEFAFTEAQRKVSELKEKQFERDAKNENALIDIAVKGVSQKLQADFMRSEELKKLDEFRDKKNKERMDEVKVSRDKVIIGLQSRMPEPLRVNAGNGFSYGQSVGGRGADILDLTRRMLNALEKLVELERYDLNPI